MLDSMRTCVAPIPLLWTIILSVIAWAAECFAYQLIFPRDGNRMQDSMPVSSSMHLRL